MILGTHTAGTDPNSLMIAKVRLPLAEQSNSDVKDPMAGGSQNIYTKESISNYSKLENKIEIETKINHQGEVNKARVMPQKYNIIATKTPCGEVHIFDYFKHKPKPADSSICPQMRLVGHTKEGYGLSWSKMREGYLASGSDDHKICIWDINVMTGTLSPLKIIEEHKGVVEDVNWYKHNDYFLASVGDDRKLILWDMKQEKAVFNIEAHSQEVNSVEFNPFNEFQLLTASNDKTVALWDIRNLSIKLHSFDHHKNDVVAARWNPNIETLFASFSSDRRVNVWDLSKIGGNQSTVDAEDGPVELLV
jgi:histone-binding protein RBBP4